MTTTKTMRARGARARVLAGWGLVLALAAGCSSETVTVELSPTTATVAAGGTWQFSATVKGTQDAAVTWAVVESGGGSVSGAGLYTAPQTAGQYTVRATSKADGRASAEARVTVTADAVAVTLTPATRRMVLGEQATFSASVQGAQDTSVTWSVEGGEANGTVTAAGVYTAPQRAGTFRVVATARADTRRSAAASVTVVDALSGTVSYAGSRTGRIYVTYGVGDEFGNLLTPLATTSLAAPGPFTLRPLRNPQSGPLVVQAFMDVPGTGTFLAAADPTVTVPLTAGGEGAGVELVLEEPVAGEAPAAVPGLSVVPGQGFLWVMFQPAQRLEGGEAADTYVISWGTQPSPTPETALGTLAVGAGTSQLPFVGYVVAIPSVAAGSYYVSVTARNGEQEGEPATLEEAVTVQDSPESSDATLAGWVDLSEVEPKTGHLYVLALNAFLEAHVWRTGAASLASTRYGFALPADGYSLYALLDSDADGRFELTEPLTDAPAFVSVDGVTEVQAPLLTLDSAPVHTVLGTERTGAWEGGFLLESSGVYVRVERGSKLPVLARLTGGPGLPPPYDMLPFDLPLGTGGIGGFELIELYPGEDVPLPAGTALTLEVRYSDDTSASLPLSVSVPPVPAFTSPGASVQGTTATFAWTLPEGAPAEGTQELTLSRQGGRGEVELWRVRLPLSARTALYDGPEALEPGLAYFWQYRMLDAGGNTVGVRGSFTAE